MTNDFIEDFLSDLCKDLNYAVDIEDLARATKLNPNTISCFGYRSKAQLPSSKQLLQMLSEVFRHHPEAAQAAVKKISALFKTISLPANGNLLETLKALVKALESD